MIHSHSLPSSVLPWKVQYFFSYSLWILRLWLLPLVFLREKFSSSSCKEEAPEEHERKAGIKSGTSSVYLWKNNVSSWQKQTFLKLFIWTLMFLGYEMQNRIRETRDGGYLQNFPCFPANEGYGFTHLAFEKYMSVAGQINCPVWSKRNVDASSSFPFVFEGRPPSNKSIHLDFYTSRWLVNTSLSLSLCVFSTRQ